MLPIVVLLRDRDLNRVGILADDELAGLELFPVTNGVGTWSLKLPHLVRNAFGAWVEHRGAAALRQPGAGIIVILPGNRRFSGPVVTPAFTESADDPRGAWTFSGVSDEVVLADRLAYPDPTVPDAQESSESKAYDTRAGAPETLMHAYVGRNIGPLAHAARQDARVTMGPDLGRGTSRIKSARFPTLLELCQELAAPDGLLFEVVQVDESLVFRTRVPTDLSAEVRLDVNSDTLDSASYAYSGPAATTVIGLGEGEAEARKIISLVSADPAAAEWGRVIEVAVDARGTSDPDELLAAASEVMAANGGEVTSLNIVPSEYNARDLGLKWWLGDTVTVNVAGVPVVAHVTKVRITVTAQGLYAGATVGDGVGFDPDKVTSNRLSGVEGRVSSLERTAEATATRGTTAARDSAYGVPSSPADQATLANRRVIWQNVETGWEESYYAPAGTVGLTARGLVTGTAAGWYPIGKGPRLSYAPTVGNNTPGSGATVTGWNGVTWVNGAGWFSYSSGNFTLLKAGRYRIAANIVLVNGAGVADFHFYVGEVYRNSAQGLYANQFAPWMDAFNDIQVVAGTVSHVKFLTPNALLIFQHGSAPDVAPARGEFTIEYLGPALVSD